MAGLFTIAPHADFLATLADRVLDGTLLGDWPRTGPFWLCDVTIVLPTRRARLALAAAFSERGHHLLPDIRTFGGDPGDEEPFLPPLDEPALPPAVSRLERQLTLAHLVKGWAETDDGREVLASPPFPAEILRLAALMGELVDDLIIEDADIRRLGVVLSERGGDLAENWQRTAKLLRVALEFWPERLQERGRIDAARLRNLRLDRQARAASLIFGDRPVIAAGSTGSIPATAALLAAIRELSRGAVVLPGLDTTLTAADEAALRNEAANPHGHPQYGLVKLLARLGAHPGDVTELAPGRNPRTELVREALALADATARWNATRHRLAPDLADALDGVAILAAANEDEEARAIALAARDGLARGLTIGIVSPDRNLARRIAAELQRHGIDVDDAAGTPLFQSPAGRLARQVLAVAAGNYAAVDLVALLRNRGALFGLARADVGQLADRIDFGLLRGQRPAPGLAGLRAALASTADGEKSRAALTLSEADRAAIADLFDRLEAAIGPLEHCLAAPDSGIAETIVALCAGVEAVIAGTGGAAIPGIAELRDWCAEIRSQRERAPRLAPTGFDAVLAALMTGVEVRLARPRREDIAIWGQLEARLQNPGLMILAGLNEDVWPEPADPGPWLSRGMRLAIGLEPPERRQGLAAHDFMMALGNREVVMAWSARIGTAPAQPSRFLQRLEALAGAGVTSELEARGDAWCRAARLIDRHANVAPAPQPTPRPPAAVRPRQLSVTEIETLIRSPYDIYARHVLGLRAVDALGAPVSGAERGTITHEIFARFVREHGRFGDPEAPAVLEALARQAFSGLEAMAERRDIWLRRFRASATMLIAFERDREDQVRRRNAEIKGRVTLPNGFTLTGRADRIDEMVDGTVAILDFKTGGVPGPANMRALLAPQLLLEAAMVRAHGFEGIAAATASDLSYLKIGLGPAALTVQPFRADDSLGLEGSVAEAWRRLSLLVEAMLFTDAAMPSRLMPDLDRSFPGDYDHLARVDEWSLGGGEEEE